VQLNQFGEIAGSTWQEIPQYYPEINNEIFIVMPNPLLSTITIGESRRAGLDPVPAAGSALSEIVRTFKAYSLRSTTA
jgi:hypothetical protein